MTKSNTAHAEEISAAKPKRARPTKKQAPAVSKHSSKIDTIIALLRDPEGTTIATMMSATGWQAHSVRGAMSGAIKKDRGLAVSSEKTAAGRVYRIPSEA